MEVALVSVATGALNSVLEKLGTLLIDKYNRLKGMCGEIKFLTDELTAMHAFLLKMSEKEDPDVQDKVWMTMVRELSYDIEDSVDDFMQGLNDKDTKPDGFIKKIKHILGTLGKRKAHHRTFQDLKNQVIEAGERNQRYKTSQAFSNTKNGTFDPRALAIFEDASKLVGIDEPKAEIIRLLTEGNVYAPVQQQQPKIVSIVGSGGMGKTTLANQVYQDLKGKFECRAFVSVSRNPNMKKILRTILSEVANKDYAHTKARDEQQLISKISNFLVDKSYFIVVDDVWNKETWDVIKYAFSMTSRGILITTTRMIDVVHSCHSSFNGHIYNMKPLHMEHSRHLFHKRLFSSKEDCPSYLEEISEQILEKCDGLPLAIIAISCLLGNTERTKQQWNQVKDSIGRALERNPSVEGMMKILSLSYFDLPSHLKGCLLYLSIFPEDSIIEKKGLIRRWVAEGLVCKEGRYTSYELGEKCFSELVNRSLIQPVKVDKYDKVLTFRVHDTILDFIVSKSIEENFVTFVGVPSLTIGRQSKTRRLSMQVYGKGNFVMPMNLILSHVRSINVFGNSVKIPSMTGFSHLRSLDFGRCRQLENYHLVNVGMLLQLRYLNISITRVSELPEQIGNLRFLEMLDIRHTNVFDLPASIVNLRKLAHLFVSGHVRFPDGIAKMQTLETLKCVSALQSYNFLQELGRLKNLRKLHFYHMYVSQEHKEVIASSLHNLCTRNLCSLTITMLSDKLSDNFLLNTRCTSPPLNLQKLTTTGFVFPKVPDWVGSLVNLQKLCLQVKRIKHEDLCILGALPALLSLGLEGKEYQSSCEDKRLTVTCDVGFRCLRVFTYWAQGDGMDLMFVARCMPKLEKLVIVFLGCDNESLSRSGAFSFGITNLSSLISFKCVLNCSGITRSTTDIVKALLERVVGTHPNKQLNLIFEDTAVRL